ncbi:MULTISPECIES: hypothetical protein [Halococcus]|uniref:hypothetical protein n=1 Tax=Halococcus TaxID=2249 RepID=UPI001375942D|nr:MULTISPECIES: hypothetical protein [Halococcus]
MAGGIDRSTGFRSLNAIPTAFWTDVVFKPVRFVTPTADVPRIAVSFLLPVGEYSHITHRYFNTMAINGIYFVEKQSHFSV